MLEYSFQENFAESQPPEGQNAGKASTAPLHLMETNESEDEPVPRSEGESFADALEVCNAVESAYKKDKNLQTKFTKYTDRKIIEIMGGKNDGRLRPDDVVEEAVLRILNLNRKWYKSRVPKIENLILMVIVSLIRIEAEKIMDIENRLYDKREETKVKTSVNKKHNKRRIISLNYKDKDGKESDTTIIDNEYYKQNNKDKYEDDFDFEQLDENELICSLEKELEEDEAAFFVFQEILDGNKSNIDIAAKLGIEVKEVENARKRIKRKAIKLTAK